MRNPRILSFVILFLAVMHVSVPAFASENVRLSEIEENLKIINQIVSTGNCATANDCEVIAYGVSPGCSPSLLQVYSKNISSVEKLYDQLDRLSQLQKEYQRNKKVGGMGCSVPRPLLSCVDNKCVLANFSTGTIDRASCAELTDYQSESVNNLRVDSGSNKKCTNSNQCGILTFGRSPECGDIERDIIRISTLDVDLKLLQCRAHRVAEILQKNLAENDSPIGCLVGFSFHRPAGQCINDACVYETN